MQISEITNPAEFEALRDEWNALVDTCANPLLYMRHEWLWAWWQYYGQGKALHVLCLRDGGRLKAGLPLIVDVMSLSGVLKFRCAHLAGQSVSAYQDAILARGWEKKAFAGLLAHIGNAHPDWDVLYLRRLHPASVLLSLCASSTLEGWHRVELPDRAISPFALLPKDSEDISQGLSKKVRQNLQRATKRLSDLGPLKLTVGDATSADRVSLDTFFHFHEARWGQENLNRRGYQHYKPFITQAFTDSLPSGTARLFTLTAGETWLAGQLCWDHLGVRHSVMVAYNPDLREQEPGNVMNLLAMQEAAQRGYAAFDFGEGEESYKYHFAAHAWRTRRLMLGRKRRKLRILACAERLAHD